MVRHFGLFQKVLIRKQINGVDIVSSRMSMTIVRAYMDTLRKTRQYWASDDDISGRREAFASEVHNVRIYYNVVSEWIRHTYIASRPASEVNPCCFSTGMECSQYNGWVGGWRSTHETGRGSSRLMMAAALRPYRTEPKKLQNHRWALSVTSSFTSHAVLVSRQWRAS